MLKAQAALDFVLRKAVDQKLKLAVLIQCVQCGMHLNQYPNFVF